MELVGHQTGEEAIAAHTRVIADLLYEQASSALRRLREAEREALEQIQQIAPRDFDYAAAAKYLSIPRRTLERRVANREIAFRKDGKRVLFTKSALDQYKTTVTTNCRECRPLTL